MNRRVHRIPQSLSPTQKRAAELDTAQVEFAIADDDDQVPTATETATQSSQVANAGSTEASDYPFSYSSDFIWVCQNQPGVRKNLFCNPC